jgi:hypothetical protein
VQQGESDMKKNILKVTASRKNPFQTQGQPYSK